MPKTPATSLRPKGLHHPVPSSEQGRGELPVACFLIHISQTQTVRFYGRIEWWQRMFMWLAGVNVTEVKG